MAPELHWRFVVDDMGKARSARPGAAVETIEPGEYLVTLPLPVASDLGVHARLAEDVGFITATPGDDAGRKLNTIRVLTFARDFGFGPRDFTVVLSTA